VSVCIIGSIVKLCAAVKFVSHDVISEPADADRQSKKTPRWSRTVEQKLAGQCMSSRQAAYLLIRFRLHCYCSGHSNTCHSDTNSVDWLSLTLCCCNNKTKCFLHIQRYFHIAFNGNADILFFLMMFKLSPQFPHNNKHQSCLFCTSVQL